VNQAADDDDATTVSSEESFLRRHPRLRRELIILSWALGTGLIIMPVLVYVVGLLSLGPYASGGWVALFVDLFKGLWRGWWAAWSLVLGPLVLVYFMRGIRLVYKRFLRSPEPESS
jgi:hypothetical protein